MSLDFALTQFYRVLLDDLVLIYDAYTVYTKKRSYASRSLKEFSEVGEWHALKIIALVFKVDK